MELMLEIPDYSGEGIKCVWNDNFEIKTALDSQGSIVISANRAGLISLARQLLTLAQEGVPVGHHIHYDDYSSLENGSVELIIEKR